MLAALYLGRSRAKQGIMFSAVTGHLGHRSSRSPVQCCQLLTVVSTVPFPIMISVGLLSKILLPHHPHASVFAFIVLLTEASPSLCAQLASAVYIGYTGKRNLGTRDLSLAWLWVSVTNPGMQVRMSWVAAPCLNQETTVPHHCNLSPSDPTAITTP